MARFMLILSFFASTLLSSDQGPEIWQEEDEPAPISTFISKQKESAFTRIMASLLAKDWPLYQPIIQNITLYLKGYAKNSAQNLNGMDGVIAGGRFLEGLIHIHKNYLPHSEDKLRELGNLHREVQDSIKLAHNSSLIFSPTKLQNARFEEQTLKVLMYLHTNPERESDTYGCTATLPLLPGFGCGIGKIKDIVGYLRPSCSMLLAWAAPLPTLSVGHYREISTSSCNCYPEIEQGFCCIGTSEYHEQKSDISECGIGCMSTNKCLASFKMALPFSLGQDCHHFAAIAGLEVKDIDPSVYQLIKQEWRSMINDCNHMEELKKALQTVLFEIAQETTTYFGK